MRALLSLVFAACLAACLDFSPMTGGKPPASASASSSSSSSSSSTSANDSPVCPDSRNLPCIGGQECTMDEKRGCMVCMCPSPFGPAPDVGGVPPIQ